MVALAHARSYLKRGLRVMGKVHSCKKLMSTKEVNDNLSPDFESTEASVGSAALGWKKIVRRCLWCFLLLAAGFIGACH